MQASPHTHTLWQETLNNHPRGLIVTTLAIVGAGLVLDPYLGPWFRTWLIASLALTGLRFALYLASRSSTLAPPDDHHQRALALAHRVGVLASGLSWAILAWNATPLLEGSHQLALLIILSAMAAGATGTLAPLRIMGKVYVLLLILPACYQLGLIGSTDSLTLAGLGLIFTWAMCGAHESNHELLQHAIQLANDKEYLIGELSRHAEQVLKINAELEARVAERTHCLHEMAHRDLLTGLLNRRGISTLEAQAQPITPDKHCMVVFIDLDRFKHINDTLGHDIGDLVLQAVAHRLETSAQHLAQQLGSPRYGVCRWGGDEFVFCLLGIHPPLQQINPALADLHTQLAQGYDIQGRELNVGASIGYAVENHGLCSIPGLISSADLAASEAKRLGRGQVVVMTPQLLELQHRRLRLLDALPRATQDGSFHLAFQPIVCATHHQPLAFEALLRWSCPGLGSISPAEFIPLAENSDQIIRLGAWVLTEACTQATGWPCAPGRPPLKVAVNTSIKQLVSSRFVAQIKHALAQSGLPPERLIVEITESVFDEINIEQTLSNLLALQHLGIEIHVDDFGTGYSSLSRLQEFPLQAVKIDKSFVHSGDERALTVIEGTILIAHKFGLRVIAEGVETEAQAATLTRLGVDEFQGYLYGRPSPDVGPWLRAQALPVTAHAAPQQG